ncbi:MAG TPA: hypothetical protein VGE15_11425 [Sphingobacteriaceae bacterium]
MISRLFILCLICGITAAYGQDTMAPADPDLRPYRMTGQDHSLKRNLAFADYRTRKIRRTLGSFFYFRPPSLVNLLKVGDIPLYRKDRLRAKDVFRLDLEKNNRPATSIECRAVLRKNEKFRLLGRQDSSFFGARNVDYLEARIRMAADTAVIWSMLAANLNGSKDEEQKGTIRNGDQEITFTKTTLLLRDLPVSQNNPVSLLASISMVYAFSMNGQVVAAVSFKEADRQFWIHEELDEPVKDVIASAASLLTIRKDLYK